MLVVAPSVPGNRTALVGEKGLRSVRDSHNELAPRTAAPKGVRATRRMPGKKLLAPADLDVIEEQVLGRGGAGNVYKGTLRGPKGPIAVAVKVLEGELKPGEPPQEFTLLEKALKGCKFVCKPLGYCEKGGKMCMVLHLYEKSLTKYIHERAGKDIPVREVVDIAKQLAEAVVTLHNKARIAHFDIKPDNVLLDAKGNCYLCDFSIAKQIPAHTRAIMLPHDAYGSTEYMAPEQVTTKRPGGIGFAADAWGVACTILELASGVPPFSGQAGVNNVMDILNILMNGNPPKIPPTVEPRLADIIRRSLVVAAPQRQDVMAMKHALSSLNELLRIEAGGIPAVPPEVLSNADLLVSPDFLTSLSRSNPMSDAQEQNSSANHAATQPSQSVPSLPPLHPPNTATARGNSATSNSSTRRSPRRSAGTLNPTHTLNSPESSSTTGGGFLEVDLLGLDNLALDHRSVSGSSVLPGPHSGSSRSRPLSAPTSASNPVAGSDRGGGQTQVWPNSIGGVVGVGLQATGSASHLYEPSEAEQVVITAGSNGCLGVKTLFRSCTRLLTNPYDTKQMTGVAVVPTVHCANRDPASRSFREAVSASAQGRLTWWDVANGAVNASLPLTSDPKVPAGAVGRSVAVHERFAAVGTDRAKLLVWQVGTGGSSWQSMNMDVAPQDRVAPWCSAVGHMTDPSARPSQNSSDQNRIYDLTLQPPWMEDAGGRWVAGASSLGNIVLWDTTTWREIYCSKATNGSIYSCCSLPGSNMVAVACPSPQLVQVYDCRQAPDNIAAVMTCDMPPRTAGGSASIGGSAGVQESGDSIYCVASVPSSGAIPSQLLLGSKRGRLYLWDLRQSGVLWTVAQLQDKILGCAASPCGHRVVAGSRAGQVAMLDWTRPLQGMQSTHTMHPYVSQWKCSNPMYLWPRLEKGILRVACGALESGSLLSGPCPPGVTTSDT